MEVAEVERDRDREAWGLDLDRGPAYDDVYDDSSLSWLQYSNGSVAHRTSRLPCGRRECTRMYRKACRTFLSTTDESYLMQQEGLCARLVAAKEGGSP
ncbi:MAG: hypothetical protein A4E19_20645 [Nitrospira sp. SG-bin1]|nr:MAG: hypothetical protein A4E19_20645 [Nitrospira sp. SG-bin1]